VVDHSEHFTRQQLECPCCHQCIVNTVLLNGLETLLTLTAEPLTLDSVYRCPKHNAFVKGTKSSYHPLGLAADTRCAALSILELYVLAEQIPRFRNGGIGLYTEGFIHLDVRGSPARWSRVEGVYRPIEDAIHWIHGHALPAPIQ
jgi:hypothetical protein